MRDFVEERYAVIAYICHIVILCLVFIIQAVVLPSFAVAGIKPDLLLLATVISGLSKGKNRGMLSGFLLGLLYDILFGQLIGLNAFAYLLIGYICGYLSDIYYEGGWRLGAILIGIGYVFHELFLYFCLFILRSRFVFLYELKHMIIPGWIYTMMASAVFYIIFDRVKVRLKRRQRSDIR